MAHLKVLALLAIAVAAQAAEHEWTQIPATSTKIHLGSIRKVATNEFEVWERVIYSESVLEYVRSQGHGAEYADYAYTTALIRIKCDTKTYGTLKATNYNSRGDPLAPPAVVSKEKFQMEAVSPGTSIDIVLDFACSHIKRNVPGNKRR